MSGAPAFDLQSHSLHSDGVLSPAAVVEKAAQAGVKLLALSDHDTVAGVDETINCTCHGSKFSIEDGSVEGGPSPSGLEAIDITVEDDRIVAV